MPRRSARAGGKSRANDLIIAFTANASSNLLKLFKCVEQVDTFFIRSSALTPGTSRGSSMGLKNFLTRFSSEWKRAPSKRKLLFAELIWRLGLDVPILTYATRDGSRLCFHAQNISLGLWKETYLDQHGVQFCLDYLKSDDWVMDVGANIGHFTVAMGKHLNHTGQIIAIEPNPSVFKCLKENVAANQLWNVQCCEYALDQVDSVSKTLFIPHRASDQGALGHNSRIARYDQIRVQCRSGDALLAELGMLNRRVNLLKVDVEGYELNVFRGMTTRLEFVDCILFEFSKDNYRQAGFSGSQVLDFLRARNFQIFQIDVVARCIKLLDQDVSCADLVAVQNSQDLIDRTGYIWNPTT
jgi:FkbM family methyltransferase